MFSPTSAPSSTVSISPTSGRGSGSGKTSVTEICEYITQDKPEAATAFVLRLEEQIGTLERFPERCPLVPENELLGTAYRHLLHGNYRTIFKIIGPRVIILRVLHGARLLDTGILERVDKL
jgi:plasmid stabilization system protein ParE